MFRILQEELLSLIPQAQASVDRVPPGFDSRRRHLHARLSQILANHLDICDAMRAIVALSREFHRHGTRFFKKRMRDSLARMADAADGLGEAAVGLIEADRSPCIDSAYLIAWRLDPKCFYRLPALVVPCHRLAVPRIESLRDAEPFVLKIPLAHPPFRRAHDPGPMGGPGDGVPGTGVDQDWRTRYREWVASCMTWMDVDMSDTSLMRDLLADAGRSLAILETAGLGLHQLLLHDFPYGNAFPMRLHADPRTAYPG